MNKEHKDLVLRELCKMVPYDTKVLVKIDGGRTQTLTWVRYTTETVGVDYSGNVLIETPCYDNYSQNVFPYLRSLSSITKEEEKELRILTGAKVLYEHIVFPTTDSFGEDNFISEECWATVFDWLDRHHLDYRGLIEKGLALEAPESMYRN